jgi:serine/threonine protein kinase
MKCPKCQTINSPDSKFCKSCATPLPAGGEQKSFTRTLETTADELTRGTVFAGRYEIIEELGAGGMGTVYRAFDKKLEEEIALKLIRPEIAAEKRTVERFRNEIKIARKITHKNVCRTHDLGEEGRALFITMEYVRGEDLKSVIRRMKVLAVGTAVSIARQVAEGLGEAHRLGVIHRDLKPSNVMIDKEGNAKIMDFGIARSLAGGGTTVEGAIIGTPEYMSPEQVDGKPADARADIYALGVILFEMVTGRPPFEGETAFSIANKHKSEPAPDPTALNPQIPADLGRLILRCLEKERERRYQTTMELLADLEAVKALLPTAERVPGRALSRTKPRTSREVTVKFTPRKLIIPALALFVILTVVIVLIKRPPRPELPTSVSPNGPPAIAVLYFKNNTGDKELDFWRQGLCQSLIIKLSQSRYIRIPDQSQIYGVLNSMNLTDEDNYTPENLKKIASTMLATHIVLGSYYKDGNRFRIDLTLQNALTMDIIAAESVDGTNILLIVDDLAGRLKSDINITAQQRATDVDRSMGDLTTHSSEAFESFLKAYPYATLGEHELAVPLYEKAVTADPQFAMAHLLLAMGYWATGRMDGFRSHLQKAYDLRFRTSERERYQIEAEYFHLTSENTWGKAIEAFTTLIDLYPWDHLGNADLPHIYWIIEEWDKAIERLEVLRRYKIADWNIGAFLPRCYLSKGQVEKAREVLGDLLITFTDNTTQAIIRAQLATVFRIQGDLDKAGKEIEKAYALFPGLDIGPKLFYLISIGNYLGAEETFNTSEASSRPISSAAYRSIVLALQGKMLSAKANLKHDSGNREVSLELELGRLGWVSLMSAHLMEKTGDFSGALGACAEVLHMSLEAGEGIHQCQALFRRGVIQARKGSLNEAGRTAEELYKIIETGPAKKRIQYYDALRGLIALQEKDAARAKDYLEKALLLAPIEDGYMYLPRTEFLDYLADAHIMSSRWDEAAKCCEEILSLKSAREFCPGNALIHVRSYYKLGKILELKGDKTGAVRNYRMFLGLWKDADPGLPEVKDAKERLIGLENSFEVAGPR